MDQTSLLNNLGINVNSMFDPWNIFLSIVFAIIGFFYVRYGRKEDSFYFIICGISLMSYTLLVSSTSQVFWIGLLLLGLPFLLDKYL